MKRKLVLGMALLLISGGLLASTKVEAKAELFLNQFPTTSVEINGNKLANGDVPPFIVSGRSVLPLKQTAEMLNAYVVWDNNRSTVVITKPIVNMTIVQERRSGVELNPSFKPGTHSFKVLTQVSNVPKSKNLKLRFKLSTTSDTEVFRGRSFTIDTTELEGGFQGNLDALNVKMENKGNYILKLEMEDPSNKDTYLTIGEYVITVE